MRLTIERMRTLVLGAGAILIVALVGLLVVARWKSHFNLREIPKKLGANIQQEANGVTYTQARGGHTLFKLHASKVVQLKLGGRALLHDVQIELYGEDGNRVDRISGDEFEWDDKNKTATAAGPVEITLTRPDQSPKVAQALPERTGKPGPMANAAKTASQGEIQVKTSGLSFDEKSGIAATVQHVEFAITQGSGSSMGATFDSEKGQLVLDHAVELDVRRGPEKVLLRARHAEFERDNLLCRLEGAVSSFRGGEATAGHAEILFRDDGSAMRLDAADGFSMTTATSARIASPRGTLEFDEHNQPRRGRLEGGATMDSSANGRQVHGSAPTADLAFTSAGLLKHVHLERGVSLHSDQSTTAEDGQRVNVSRDWRSPVAEAEFREAGKGQVELASVTGTGGVVIAGETQRGSGPVVPSRMAADQVTATFGERQELASALGTGHANLEQTTSSGAKQLTSGDRIEAVFAPVTAGGNKPRATSNPSSPGGEQIESATVEGNVVLIQQPAAKSGNPSQAPLRATAGRALYEGTGEWLHLSLNPRVESGALQLTAEKLDVSQSSGDAFAHGNVKATWMGQEAGKPAAGLTSGAAFGGQGPAHVVAAEAQLHQASGEATFRGHARLWQEDNSISAPVIVLDRTRQTLVARTNSGADPVRVVMLSAGRAMGRPAGPARASLVKGEAGKPGTPANGGPSVVRVRGGDLKYSEAERKAVMHGGAAGNVEAETGTATVVSNDVELQLLPAGNHAGADGSSTQVDRLTAMGNVSVNSQGRRGTGERLVYTSETSEYVLMGTPSNPPRMTDPARGTVSGTSLIFNSRDDSVSIEGNGQKTSTETVAPRSKE